MTGNLSINPGDVSQAMYGSSPYSAQYSNIYSVPTFGKLNLQGPSIDCFQKSKDKSEIPWKGIGAALFAAGLFFGCKKYASGQTGWQKIAALFKNNAGKESLTLTQSLIPTHQQALINGQLAQRTKTFEGVNKIFTSEHITLTQEQFNALKKADTKENVLDALKGVITDNTQKNALNKLLKDENAKAVIENWAEATAKYNVTKNPFREASKKLADAANIKSIRNADLNNIKNGQVKKLIEAMPDADRAKVYELVNTDKGEDALKLINKFAKTNEGKAVTGSNWTDLTPDTEGMKAWFKSSKNAHSFNPAVVEEAAKLKISNLEKEYTDIVSTWSDKAKEEFTKAINDGKPLNDALSAARQVKDSNINDETINKIKNLFMPIAYI